MTSMIFVFGRGLLKDKIVWGLEVDKPLSVGNLGTYFFDECLKSEIMVDEIYYLNQMNKVYNDHEMNNQERRRTVF